MTREEAIKIIKECKEKGFKYTFYTGNEYDAALDMAIKALEQEPCEDAISRQAAIDAIRASASKYTGFMEMEMYTDDDAVEAIKGLPSAQSDVPDTNVGDIISRQASIGAVETIGHIATMPDGDKCVRKSAVKYTLSMLPPAQPEIIRCKDCKHCDRGIDEDGIPFLKCLGWSYGGTQENDFCSHAERRTDE